MKLTDEQQKTLEKWIAEGAGLSEIQKRLRSEFSLNVTYMDARFLLIDLGLKLKEAPAPDPRKPKPTDNLEPQAPNDDADMPADIEDDEPAPAGGIGTVKVSVDRIVQPGSIVSGNVTFSDGVSGKWGLDQLGRLGLQTGKEGYRPSQSDIRAFQMELKKILEKQGYG